MLGMAMDDRATWRPARFGTEERRGAAAAVRDRLQAIYGVRLRAVAVEGSTAKGLDLPESDLELRAVVEGGETHRWYACFRRGLFVGVSLVTEAQARRDAAAVDYEWPSQGDVWDTAQVLYDPDGLYPALRAVAAAAAAAADFMTLTRESLTDLYEHVYKVFTAGEDEATAAHEARQVAFWAANTVALPHRHRYRGSRTLFAESAALPGLPAGYAGRVRGLLALRTDAAALRRDTGALWTAFVPWAADRGITLDDDTLEGL